MDPNLVVGGLLGVIFQELYTTIKSCTKPTLTRVSTLRSQLESIAGKLNQLSHKFSAINRRYPEAGVRRETLKLRELLEKANKLVRDCTWLSWWDLGEKRRFSKRLKELAASLEMLQSVDINGAVLMRRLLTLEAGVMEMNAKLDRMYAGTLQQAPRNNYSSPAVVFPPRVRGNFIPGAAGGVGGNIMCINATGQGMRAAIMGISGGQQGMRAAIRYERTERAEAFYFSMSMDCSCARAPPTANGYGGGVYRRRNYRKLG